MYVETNLSIITCTVISKQQSTWAMQAKYVMNIDPKQTKNRPESNTSISIQAIVEQKGLLEAFLLMLGRSSHSPFHYKEDSGLHSQETKDATILPLLFFVSFKYGCCVDPVILNQRKIMN